MGLALKKNFKFHSYLRNVDNGLKWNNGSRIKTLNCYEAILGINLFETDREIQKKMIGLKWNKGSRVKKSLKNPILNL